MNINKALERMRLESDERHDGDMSPHLYQQPNGALPTRGGYNITKQPMPNTAHVVSSVNLDPLVQDLPHDEVDDIEFRDSWADFRFPLTEEEAERERAEEEEEDRRIAARRQAWSDAHPDCDVFGLASSPEEDTLDDTAAPDYELPYIWGKNVCKAVKLALWLISEKHRDPIAACMIAANSFSVSKKAVVYHISQAVGPLPSRDKRSRKRRS